MKRTALFLATAFAATMAHAADPAISVGTLKEVTKTLSSDTFEGRAPTTAGEDKTVGYIAGRFAAAGLQPANKGSWFQDVPMVRMTVNPATSMKVTGGKGPLDLAYKSDLVVNSYRILPKTEIKDSDIVFLGYGINAPEKGWNDYKGVDVKGKTVVILVNDPDYEAKDLKGPFGGRAMTYYGRWTYKYEEAARQGAAAAIIVHDTYPAAYPWGVVVSSWTGPQIHMDAADQHMGETQANGWMSNDAAVKLMAAAGKDLAQLSAAAKKKGFKAVPLGDVLREVLSDLEVRIEQVGATIEAAVRGLAQYDLDFLTVHGDPQVVSAAATGASARHSGRAWRSSSSARSSATRYIRLDSRPRLSPTYPISRCRSSLASRRPRSQVRPWALWTVMAYPCLT